MVTSHSITLMGLSMGTTYHFMVTSTAGNGTSASSGDNTFRTSGPITITIVSPLDNATINRPDVMVRGTVTNSTGNETGVTVNGMVATVYNGQFFVNHVPLQDGQNAITANAVDTTGNTAAHSILVNANTTSPHITLNANIESGIAPLTSYFSVSTSIPNSVASYAFDYDGDAVIDYTGTNFDDISVTYSAEGIYYPTVYVTDDHSNTYTDTIVIIVLNQTELDTLLKAKWNAMKMALGNGDVNGAVVNFDSDTQGIYHDQFTALSPILTDIVNELSNSQVNMVSIEDEIVQYEILVVRGGTTFSLHLKFLKDNNGLWKMWGF
jgi:hypothetical protein